MKIELLVGMIASGKSTYARRRADEGALVVSHDDLTEMLHARYRYETELRDMYRRMEEDLVRHGLKAGRDVIVDRTHLTRESRSRWVQFSRWPSFAQWELPVILAVVFPILDPEIHARRRFESDSRGRSLEDWTMVARHHAEQARNEPILPTEGFARIDLVTVSFHGAESAPCDVVDLFV